MDSKSLKNKVVHGVLWSAIDRFSSQGIAFIISIVLARLLTPHDYGLIAMIGIFISISETFVDSGLSSALVRNKNRSEIDCSTAFYVNIVIGAVCYGILFVCAPLVSKFYNEPELSNITRAMGIVFFLFSFSNVQQAILTIKIDFKTKTKISLISVITSGVIGVVLAYMKFGVWALVVQQISYAFIRVVLQWILIKWRPLFAFSISSFRSLFSFGSKMLATGLLNSISNNLYTLIIGKAYAADSLGYYSRAGQFVQFPSTSITNIIKSVSFPTMSVIQDNDERFKMNFLRIQKTVTFVVFPLIIGLASISKPLIILLLSEKWIYSSILMQIICMGLIWYPVYTQNLNIMEVKGCSRYVLQSETITKVTNISLLLLSLPIGLEAICYSQVISNIISVVVSNYFITKTINVKYHILFVTIWKNVVFSCIMGIFSYSSQMLVEDSGMKLFVAITIGILIYLFLQYSFNRKTIVEFFKILKK